MYLTPSFGFRVFWLLFILSAEAWAIQWQIVGQVSEKPVYEGTTQADLKQSVGALTVAILQENKIPFVGEAYGMQSILGTPTGDAALVIESDDTMRAYGWCVEVDGVILEEMPDKKFFSRQSSKVKWFFAFATYEKGEWIHFCTPAFKKPLRINSFENI